MGRTFTNNLTKEQVDESGPSSLNLRYQLSARMAYMDKIEEIYDVRNEYEIDI